MKTDETPKHKHNAPEVGTIEWFFHHPDHDQIAHCVGSALNAYIIEHSGKKHRINKRYARGHGINKRPQWFKFTKKIKSGWWDLSSSEKIDVANVPISFKQGN